LTKTDISQTTETYSEILESAEEYRKALLTVSEAAGNFGAALEKGAKCKGSGNAADGLLSAGGLFFLVANHQQILAHSIKESFEDPVHKEIAEFKERSSKNDEIFKVNIKDRVKTLKQQERENAKLSRSKTRNLVAYKSKLLQLTSHIDEIDKLKHEYYQSSFDLVQDTSNNILKKLGSIVRAQVEIYEGIARKGWSGGGLDELIAQCPDPFTPDEDDEEVDNDEDTMEDDGRLLTSSNGLSFNRNSIAIQPVLTHQQSMNTLQTIPESVVASTPIASKFKESITANDSVDDNSFSLPLPGSSRRVDIHLLQKDDDKGDGGTNNGHKNGKEADNENRDGDDDGRRKTPKQDILEEFPGNSECRDTDHADD
jgi:protein-tyrosine-phosphatase